MTPNGFSTFAVCLEYLPHGTAPAWDDGCARFYHAVLSTIPDDAVEVLMIAVGTQFTFRPTPHDILTLWHKISAPPADAAEEIAGLMLRKRREHGLYQRRIPNDPWCRWEVCEPPWGADQATLRRVSIGMGGWSAFCADGSPLGVLRSQLAKLAAAVIGGSGDADIDRLRLEYERDRPAAALPSPDSSAGSFAPVSTSEPVSRAEASGLMARLGACVPTIPQAPAVRLGKERQAV